MTSVGVAVITCNGEAFVAEQVSSILAQTRRPDQLVVVDDASTDETAEIVDRLLNGFPGQVSLSINPARLGVVGNISRALAELTTDVVLLADQDDVWEPDKLAVMAARFDRDPGVDGVFSDATLIDSLGTSTGSRLWQSVGFGEPEQQQWQSDPIGLLLRREIVTGATLAIRHSALARLLPIPVSPGGLHDSWIALLLAADGRLGFETRPLIRYRQHDANVAGLHQGGWRDRLRRGRQALDDASARARFLSAAAQRIDDADEARRLTDAAAHLEARGGLVGNPFRRLTTIARESSAGRYQRYSGGWRTAVWDFGVPRSG